jgi:hypothetical protein
MVSSTRLNHFAEDFGDVFEGRLQKVAGGSFPRSLPAGAFGASEIDGRLSSGGRTVLQKLASWATLGVAGVAAGSGNARSLCVFEGIALTADHDACRCEAASNDR